MLAKTLIAARHAGALSPGDGLLRLVNNLRSRQDYVGWLVRLLGLRSAFCCQIHRSGRITRHSQGAYIVQCLLCLQRHSRHTCITNIAEGQASEQTIMSIAGHLSRKMLEHYSHIRMAAKRAALDAIAAQPSQPILEAGVNQNVNQLPASDSRVAAKPLN